MRVNLELWHLICSFYYTFSYIWDHQFYFCFLHLRPEGVCVIQNYVVYIVMLRENRQSSWTSPRHYVDKGLTIGKCWFRSGLEEGPWLLCKAWWRHYRIWRRKSHLCHSFLTNSCVEFIWRQTNEIAHALQGVSTSRVSSQIYIQSCINDLISNEML
jgi:hypothetical protein